MENRIQYGTDAEYKRWLETKRNNVTLEQYETAMTLLDVPRLNVTNKAKEVCKGARLALNELYLQTGLAERTSIMTASHELPLLILSSLVLDPVTEIKNGEVSEDTRKAALLAVWLD